MLTDDLRNSDLPLQLYAFTWVSSLIGGPIIKQWLVEGLIVGCSTSGGKYVMNIKDENKFDNI